MSSFIFCAPRQILFWVSNQEERWTGLVALTGRVDCRGLLRKPEGKRSIGIPRRRGEDDIKMDLYEGDGSMDWTDLA